MHISELVSKQIKKVIITDLVHIKVRKHKKSQNNSQRRIFQYCLQINKQINKQLKQDNKFFLSKQINKQLQGKKLFKFQNLFIKKTKYNSNQLTDMNSYGNINIFQFNKEIKQND
ncbi:hypothetical protein ABPG74_004203 [Tetrahymena malaccensis]